jgi:hypothetical protein
MPFGEMPFGEPAGYRTYNPCNRMMPGHLTSGIACFGWVFSYEAEQGCQMVYFQTKNLNLGTFLSALEWKMFLYCMIIWNILWPFGIIYRILVFLVCGHLVYF